MSSVKPSRGKKRAVELSNRTKVRNAQINVIEATHIRFQLSARLRSSDRLARSVAPFRRGTRRSFVQPSFACPLGNGKSRDVRR